MSRGGLGWRARIDGALRLLTGRGDDAVACSFCGQNRQTAGDIVTGPGVAICAQCAQTALSCCHADRLARAHGNERPRFMVSFVIDPGERLPDSSLAPIENTLSETAREHGCDLASWYLARAMAPAQGDFLALDAFLPEASKDVDTSRLQEALCDALRQKLSLPQRPPEVSSSDGTSQ